MPGYHQFLANSTLRFYRQDYGDAEDITKVRQRNDETVELGHGILFGYYQDPTQEVILLIKEVSDQANPLPTFMTTAEWQEVEAAVSSAFPYNFIGKLANFLENLNKP